MSYKFEALITILNKLDRKERVTAAALAEELSVSERTVYRYLNTLQAAEFPVIFDRTQGSYAFMEGYGLKKPGLSPEEKLALGISRMILAGWGKGWGESLKNIEAKLSGGFSELPRHIVLSFQAQGPEVTDRLVLLHRAILGFQRVKLAYRACIRTSHRSARWIPIIFFLRMGFGMFEGFVISAKRCGPSPWIGSAR